MSRYTQGLIATLRQRYEDTDQFVASIAAEFEIGTRTLQKIAAREGWRRRRDRVRGLPIAVSLLEEAKALGAKQSQPGHSRESGNLVIADGAKSEPPGVLGPRFRGDDRCESASAQITLLTPPEQNETPSPTLPLQGEGVHPRSSTSKPLW